MSFRTSTSGTSSVSLTSLSLLTTGGVNLTSALTGGGGGGRSGGGGGGGGVFSSSAGGGAKSTSVITRCVTGATSSFPCMNLDISGKLIKSRNTEIPIKAAIEMCLL